MESATEMTDDSATESMTEEEENSEQTSEFSCEDADHPSVGQMAIFSNLAHEVAGQVLIKDNCTLEVTSFTYDGGGPLVYFYGGIDGAFSDEDGGFPIGEAINGQRFDNETLILKLNSPADLDNMNEISVWCQDFNVSFGDGPFI